jgi:hypothetical protein
MTELDGVRREQAEQLGLDDALVDALVDLAPACDWDRHSTGETGCEPGARAEYVIRLRPHCMIGGLVPSIVLICEAQQIRLRGRSNETLTCEMCGSPTSWPALVDFLGPLEEYHPHV